MEGGDADASGRQERRPTHPVSPLPRGREEVPSDPLLSQGGIATVLRRTIESTDRILGVLGRQGLRRQDLGLDDAYRNGRFGAVPATSEAIACLLETTVAETREKDCAVCFESYEEGDKIRRMPCSHGFHEGCIIRWLGVSRLCPLCRFKLQAAS
ncbi:hypothetical protein BAE44_0004003 [Dichanthelium oligosanthes]|uniref:RING-type domain-containing protein n=1 Tax=Dichanthelium oligosanthes TaxID=888268 RepID=A0A1E5WC19_9POAL|nr:hypothetical protein BAE44_0004003 [Dichanthelium oligosanthes]